jgi:deoxyribodipyrimidine photolyase-related protein
MRQFTTLRLILGDQLNTHHSWFSNKDPKILYTLMEVRQETDYTRHHIQKITAFFAAMREFARHLKHQGHSVAYIRLDDKDNDQCFEKNLLQLIRKHTITIFEYQLPDEYRLDQQLQKITRTLPVSVSSYDTEHFLAPRHAVHDFFKNKKQYLMESFYRFMRKEHEILMENQKPEGGKWNFDAANRHPYEKKIPIPAPRLFDNDVSDIRKMIDHHQVSWFGEISENKLIWPVNRFQALDLMNYFIRYGLPWFGTYQDAMTHASETLFHSRLSFALNTKMLHPMEVINAAVTRWHNEPDHLNIFQVEGFVRQILGWREYMRGIYWALMPRFEKMNFFSHKEKLPHYFWDADTKMNCMHMALKQSLQTAYAHHIQRLMITGNFALLAGIAPNAVDEWYLGVYIDAVEWVEKPNTRGMSQYADGGLIATKPYVSSANYINKMSDYCRQCNYEFKKLYGQGACPFNSLFWDFHHRHRPLLEKNARIGMMYRTWDKKPDAEKQKILAQAAIYKETLESL